MSAWSVSRGRRVAVAWLLFAAGAGMVLYLGSDRFGVATSGRILDPIIDWLFPDWTALERWTFHVRARKVAHVTEYALLATLAFHAVFVTLETLLARIAALSLLMVLAVSATDEIRQSFSTTRTGALGDVGFDLAGALAALALVVLLRRRRERRAVGTGAS